MTARRRKGEKVQTDDDEKEGNENTSTSPTGKDKVVAVKATAVAVEATSVNRLEAPLQIVRNLAIYRFILFCIIVYDYAHYLPHHPWPGRDKGIDTWFTYDQFEFFYDFAPKQNDPVWGAEASRMLYLMGIAAGILAAVGGIPGVAFSFEMAGITVLSLYAFRFFTFVQFFTNHNYLFLLLGILVTVSGGGSYNPTTSSGHSSNQTPEQQRERLQKLIQKCEWAAIMLRVQYATVYLCASVWKITPDWLDGSICKSIFLTFQEQGVNRGVPWKDLYAEFGDPLFRLVALGGVILDTSMFLALAFRRPNQKTTKLFGVLSIMFHGFVCFTMSQRIGYTFPSCCLAGSLIFQPIGNVSNQEEEEDEYAMSKKNDDHNTQKKDDKKCNRMIAAQDDDDEGNVLQWIYRYAAGTKTARATPGQRYFALLWTLFQVGMPLRMPIISQGTFPFTARCYRFSWTMMLHSRSSFIVHTGNHSNPDGTLSDIPFFIPFDMINLYPECADVVPILRSSYQPNSIYKHSDPRTIPLITENHGIIQMRQRALIDQFPRHAARVGGGWSESFFQKIPDACKSTSTGETRRLSVYGVVFSRLNGKGAYYRVFDPTVNLAEAEQARKKRSWWETLKGVALDQGPPGYEYLLMKGMGSMNQKADNYKQQLAKSYPQAKEIVLIADRAACLAARPFTLWPSGFPLAVVPLEIPYNVELGLSRRQLPEGTPPDKQWDALTEPVGTILSLGKFEMTNDVMIEFRTKAANSFNLGKCGETTEEDTLFALLFMQ